MTNEEAILEMIKRFSETAAVAMKNGQKVEGAVYGGGYRIPKEGIVYQVEDGSAVLLVVIGPLPPEKHLGDAVYAPPTFSG